MSGLILPIFPCLPDVFFGKFDSDAVFNVIQNQVPPAFGDKVGDFDPRPDVIVFFDDFEQFVDMLRGFFADNQQDRPGRTERRVNDVSFGVYGVEFSDICQMEATLRSTRLMCRIFGK